MLCHIHHLADVCSFDHPSFLICIVQGLRHVVFPKNGKGRLSLQNFCAVTPIEDEASVRGRKGDAITQI